MTEDPFGSFGPHLMLDLVGCPVKILSDLQVHFNFLNEVPTIIGMTKITQPHVFPYSGLVPEDRGITGVVIIAESHLSVHSFEQKGYCFIDIFSCKPFDTDRVLQEVLNRFEPSSYERQLSRRGRDFPH